MVNQTFYVFILGVVISLVVDNKKLLQAHIDGAKLGQSATQLYTYEVMLWRTPIILTTNKWDYSTLPPEDVEWIESNCMAVAVDEPVWLEAAIPSEVEVPRPSALLVSEPSRGPEEASRQRQRRPAAALQTRLPSPEHKQLAAACSACGQQLPRTVAPFPV